MHNYICPSCGAKYEIEQSGSYECQCGREFYFEVKPQTNTDKNGRPKRLITVLLCTCFFISGLVIGGISATVFILKQDKNKETVNTMTPNMPKAEDASPFSDSYAR